MKRLVAVLVFALSVAGRTADLPEVDLLVYLPDVGAEISAAEVRRQVETYADYLRKSKVAAASVTLVGSVKELKEKLATRSQDRPTFGVLHPLIAAVLSDQESIRPMAFPVQQGSPLAPRVVVCSRGSGFHSIDDLRGKKLVITRPWEEIPDLLGLLLTGDRQRTDRYFAGLLLAETSAQAAAVVLGHKADAGLVSNYIFETSRKRLKEVWRNLEKIGETPPLHISLVVAFEGAPKDLEEKILEALLNAKDSRAGRKLLEAFKLDGFVKATKQDLDQTEGKLIDAFLTEGRRTVEATRMGDKIGVTIRLASPLREGEQAEAHVPDGSTIPLRCIRLTCTGIVEAPSGTKLAFDVFARTEEQERAIGSFELTAP